MANPVVQFEHVTESSSTRSSKYDALLTQLEGMKKDQRAIIGDINVHTLSALAAKLNAKGREDGLRYAVRKTSKGHSVILIENKSK
jgi:hypothetical protein